MRAAQSVVGAVVGFFVGYQVGCVVGLFVGARVSHFVLLPQGQPERETRVLNMVSAMDSEGFGNCTNEFECEAACPKEISVDNIARMNREYLRAAAKAE